MSSRAASQGWGLGGRRGQHSGSRPDPSGEPAAVTYPWPQFPLLPDGVLRRVRYEDGGPVLEGGVRSRWPPQGSTWRRFLQKVWRT